MTADRTSIGDYAVLGDCHTTALVSRRGSIDWLCFPRPDSPAIFCHLLDDQHGGTFWVRANEGTTSRAYVDDTNVLVTTWTTADGGVLEVTDAMPLRPRGESVTDVEPRRGVLRRLRCLAGEVEAELRVSPRFEYGLVVPRLRLPTPHVADFVGGGSSLRVTSTHPLDRRDAATLRRGDVLIGAWRLRPGETAWVEATWARAHLAPTDLPEPDPAACAERLETTLAFWRRWAGRCHYNGKHEEPVRRSALVLKALTYAPTGAVVAAATTSLPEQIGGERNWDYRYTWIRDATLTLTSMMVLGYTEELAAFKGWLERTGAGRPQDLQIMYGVEGERLLPEVELDHLAGHAGSRPVRIGNGAVKQLQLDSYGQLLQAAWLFRRSGGELTEDNVRFLVGLADVVCSRWRQPDRGIWEVRGEPRHFTHSKLNCWLALLRAGQLVAAAGQVAPAHWEEQRQEIHALLLDDARRRGWFAQAVGSDEPDAAALLVPALGLVASTDPLVDATVQVVRERLSGPGGLLRRYESDDGLAGGEGAFLLCSFWLADVLVHSGRLDQGQELLERLLACANDVGVLSEEVDPATGEQLGNTPQAFTHMAVVASCEYLSAGRRGQLPDGGAHDYSELAVERLVGTRSDVRPLSPSWAGSG